MRVWFYGGPLVFNYSSYINISMKYSFYYMDGPICYMDLVLLQQADIFGHTVIYTPMKYSFLPVFIIITAISSCQSPSTSKKQDAANQVALFDEENNNIAMEVKSFDGKLYIFGRHFSKSNESADYTSTLVIMDTSLNKLSERNYGSVKENQKEFLKSFEVDDKGNTYFAGSKGETPVIQKCDASGKIIWHKEYTNMVNATSFEKILRDGNYLYLISTGGGAINIAMLTTQVIRIDTSGNITWTTTAGEFSPSFGFHIVAGKLILMAPALNFSIDDSPYTRIICISQNGKYEWYRNFTSNDSKIRLGTKPVKSQIGTDQKSVLFYYNSSNQFLPDFGLASVDTTGTIKIMVSKKADDMPVCNNDAAIFMCYDLYMSRPGRAYAKVMVTEGNEFCRANTDYDLLDYTTINNHKYFIGNMQNPAKFFSHWIVRK
jgi:hypothetical protein